VEVVPELELDLGALRVLPEPLDERSQLGNRAVQVASPQQTDREPVCALGICAAAGAGGDGDRG
jgi:hypothetical protein